ncbi:hypothetical protein V2J09_015052 [Rumex salicifolius]
MLPLETTDALKASGRTAEKLSLPLLQSKMKVDPEGYDMELQLIYKQFKSSLELFKQQAALNFNSLSGIGADNTVAKDLADRAMFLAHMRPFYPQHLSPFPNQLADLLRTSARSLPSALRCQVVQALILLMNRKAVELEDMLSLFMELQTLGDKNLRKLAFSHVIHSIRRMNQKHKDEAKNRPLQRIVFQMRQKDEESIAKASLIVLCDLHRRRVWFDERTANEICRACFHSSSKIMKAALQFLLDYEKIEDNSDSDDSSSEDEDTPLNTQINVSKEDVYKAHHKGTTSSKKKKKAKLQRVIRSMKKRQRLTSEKSSSNYYSPLNHLNDPTGFAEDLFSRLQNCNERFEVKMMLLKVTARTIGLHRITLANFYSYLQKYVQPHQRDVTNLLAAAVQACHDMVPPNVVEPLFKQIVNQFVNDRSRPEAIAVGLNVVREICLRIPLLMTETLLQDLVLYKKEKEKAVSSAARSLMSLFREICPSLLVKKDRGRPIDPMARPKAYGEVNVASNVSGIELLQDTSDEDKDGGGTCSENEMEDFAAGSSDDDDDDDLNLSADFDCAQSGDESDEGGISSADDESESNDGSDDEEEVDLNESQDSGEIRKQSNSKKRKASDFDEQIDAADKSLRALKKLASAKIGSDQLDSENGILSNEEFKRIRELKARAEAKAALSHHGLLKKGSDSKSGAMKIPSSDQLSLTRVDPSKLEARMHRKMTKDERMALVKAGREDRGSYQAKTACKQKKKGGMSNKQKEHKKFMPIAAKRSKVAKSRIDKKKKRSIADKQFRGKKAWK